MGGRHSSIEAAPRPYQAKYALVVESMLRMTVDALSVAARTFLQSAAEVLSGKGIIRSRWLEKKGFGGSRKKCGMSGGDVLWEHRSWNYLVDMRGFSPHNSHRSLSD